MPAGGGYPTPFPPLPPVRTPCLLQFATVLLLVASLDAAANPADASIKRPGPLIRRTRGAAGQGHAPSTRTR